LLLQFGFFQTGTGNKAVNRQVMGYSKLLGYLDRHDKQFREQYPHPVTATTVLHAHMRTEALSIQLYTLDSLTVHVRSNKDLTLPDKPSSPNLSPPEDEGIEPLQIILSLRQLKDIGPHKVVSQWGEVLYQVYNHNRFACRRALGRLLLGRRLISLSLFIRHELGIVRSKRSPFLRYEGGLIEIGFIGWSWHVFLLSLVVRLYRVRAQAHLLQG
jgi:hypothetical protein